MKNYSDFEKAWKEKVGNQDDLYHPFRALYSAVVRARPDRTEDGPRWKAVNDVLGYGAATSVNICKIFDLDPDEIVKGSFCQHCEDNISYSLSRGRQEEQIE